MNELIISTSAFDAFRTDEGIVIHQKRRGVLELAAFLIILGGFVWGLSLILENVNFSSMRRFRWVRYIAPAAYYVGLFAVGFGAVIAAVTAIVKPGTVTFDKNKREMRKRLLRKPLPFQDIHNLHCRSQNFVLCQMASIAYTDHGLPGRVTGLPILTRNADRINDFARELQKLVYEKPESPGN